MAGTDNLAGLYKNRYQWICKMFEEPVQAEAENECRKFLQDASIPLYQRVGCHYLLYHASDTPELEIDFAIKWNSVMRDQIEKGLLERKMLRWVDRMEPLLAEAKELLLAEVSAEGRVQGSEMAGEAGPGSPSSASNTDRDEAASQIFSDVPGLTQSSTVASTLSVRSTPAPETGHPHAHPAPQFYADNEDLGHPHAHPRLAHRPLAIPKSRKSKKYGGGHGHDIITEEEE